MSANRHLGRIIVLQTLYEGSFRIECGDKTFSIAKVLNRNISRYRANVEDKQFVSQLANGVSKSAETIDAKLQPIAPDWPLNQIARIDHLILQIGAYELMFAKDVPPKVVINEAVELAKAFGGDNSSKFINGVLGTLLRQIDGTAAKKPKSKTAKPKTTKKTKQVKDKN